MNISILLFRVLTSLQFVRKMSLVLKFQYFSIFSQNNLHNLHGRKTRIIPSSTDYENSEVHQLKLDLDKYAIICPFILF